MTKANLENFRLTGHNALKNDTGGHWKTYISSVVQEHERWKDSKKKTLLTATKDKKAWIFIIRHVLKEHDTRKKMPAILVLVFRLSSLK